MEEVKIEIKELLEENQWRDAFKVVKQLRTDLNEDKYLQLVKLIHNDGYRMISLLENNEIVAIIGFTICTNLHSGKHIWVDDLITDENKRSKGYGEKLLSYVENIGRKNGCEILSLSSGLQRPKAHKFYEERMHFNKISYLFKKNL
ncbi:MAG: GNAT family N-acetyltransferase [Clostridium sp.]|uniref:GNAT family N-acetyltransferase n=1 Tax=Clostridium sp. TaxID=1506 RepID=UPI0029124214|nr:GNAT family N-acetyltransferase [Clostridium sp.]MDU5108911.1 GNAT family N-acetyltransferase [Clostridium sp.]